VCVPFIQLTHSLNHSPNNLGTPENIEKTRQQLQKENSISTKLLKVNRAFHHEIEMKEASEKMERFMNTTIKTSKSRIPVMSNVTGSQAGEYEMCKGSYWRDHMTRTVRFEDNVRSIQKKYSKRGVTIFEVGPGHVLTTLWKKCSSTDNNNNNNNNNKIRTCRGPRDTEEITYDEIRAQCWCVLNTSVFTSDFSSASFVSLPGYSFESTSFWMNPDRSIYVNHSSSTSLSSKSSRQTTTMTSTQSTKYNYKHLVQLSNTSTNIKYILFGFTFAGGSARTFQKWRNESIDIVGIELPGHGELSEEEHLTNKEEDEIFLRNVTKEIENYVVSKNNNNAKVILVGLSMGALFAIEIASRLDKNVIVVDAVLVAGRTPVQEEDQPSSASKYAMIDSDSKAWTTHFLPLLKIDLSTDCRMYERVMIREKRRVETLFLAFCGDEDDAFVWKDLPQWRSYCTNPKLFYGFMLQGKHSFLMNQADEMRDMLLSVMRRHEIKVSQQRHEVNESCRVVRWVELHSLQSSKENVVITEYTLHADGTGLPSVTKLPNQIRIHIEDSSSTVQVVKFLEFVQKIIVLESKPRIDITLLSQAMFSEGTAMVMGLSKCLELEFPDKIRVRRVYYYINTAEDKHVSSSFLEFEHDILLRDGKTYGLRIVPNTASTTTTTTTTTKVLNSEEGCYVITGGTGGIGGVLVKWMIETQHVRPENIILLTRKKNAVNRQGVRFVTLDISTSTQTQIQDILKDLKRVDGIFHLAGTLDDGIVLNMNKSRVERVVAPKRGGMRLLRVAKELRWGTKLFVSFSSTSSLLGYPGQSSYAAANSIFDHRVMFEQLENLRFVCLNWGPWGEVGMARRGTKAYEMSRRSSEIPMKSETCLRCLEKALISKSQNWWMIARVEDWNKTRWGSHRGIVKELVGDILNEEEKKEEEIISSSVETWLRERVSAWRPNDTLGELGIDSLDEVQMRTDFQNRFRVNVKMEVFVGAGRTLSELKVLLEKCIEG